MDYMSKVRLTKQKVWVIKHRAGKSPVRGGIFEDRFSASIVFNTLTPWDRKDYEIVACWLTADIKRKVKKKAK